MSKPRATHSRKLAWTWPFQFQPPDPVHFDVSKAPIHVESRWILRFDFDALDEDDAIERARESSNLFTAALDASLESSQPFHLEILVLGEEGSCQRRSKNPRPMPSTWNVHPIRVAAFDEQDELELGKRIGVLLRRDQSPGTRAARAAGQLLQEATYLADASMGKALLENASLLLYFQVIEGISQFVAKRKTRPRRRRLT